MKGLTAKKEKNFSEWYTQILQKSELIDLRFGIQGFLVHRPWGFFLLKKIYEYLEEELCNTYHEQFLFPMVVKGENLKKEKEHAGFTPNVFWVTKGGDKKLEEPFALRPTGEAQIYPMYSLWFNSHNDLPFKGFQSRIPSFRNEMTTRPLIRGREFMFFESHNVFNIHKESLKQIKEDIEISKKVIKEKVKIPYLYFKRPQWDKFMGADDTFAPDTLMPDGKRNQLASTHDLGQNFSKAYNIKVKGKDEKEHLVYQTCFGPGVWRIMAAVIGIHGDDKGLILPFDIAPLQLIIIPITFTKKKSESQKIMKKCQELETKLKKHGYRIKFDNSEESPGYKYNKWELKGVPIRLEIGPKEIKNKKISLVLRTEGKRKQASLTNIDKEIKKYSKKLDKDIETKAQSYFRNKTKKASSLKELKDIMKKYRGFIKVPFCTMEKQGEKCADKLKSETNGGNVCGTLYPKEIKSKNQKCIVCNKKAKHIVYIAKSY